MSKFDFNNLTQRLKSAIGVDLFSENISMALELAYHYHNGQFRETNGTLKNRPPYILHPLGVAILAHENFKVIKLDDSHEDIIMASLTHDLLEDTDITASELGRICSTRVAEIVQILTKPSVQAGESHESRNKRFLEQIIEGGLSTMFLKVCDSMHNLGRPNQSPPKLIRKAIKKAQRDYLTFFEKGLDSQRFKLIYENKIINTSKELKKIEYQDSKASVLTLEEAIDKAVLYSEQKVLELHDIREIFQEITGATISFELSKKELIEHLIFDSNAVHQKTKKSIIKKIESGMLNKNDLPKIHRHDFWHEIDIFYILKFTTKWDLKESRYLYSFGYSDQHCPKWVNKNSLKLIFNYLTERLRHSENTKYVALSSDAGSLGLDLLPKDLEKTKFSYSSLLTMQNILSDAEYIKNLLTIEFSKSFENNNITLINALESRIKTPQSIINKIINRKLKTIHHVEDIIGFRIVCIDTLEQEKLIKIIDEVCTAQQLYSSDKNDGDTLIKTKDGYRAHHLHYSFKTKKTDALTIRCEIQIRTIFQDAWARISHSFNYKMSKNTNLSVLKKLSKLCAESDSTVLEIRSDNS